MRDRKLVGSRQRSLSSRFVLPRRERPLLAGKLLDDSEVEINDVLGDGDNITFIVRI